MEQHSAAPKKKTSTGVLVVAYAIGSCFGLGLIMAIARTGMPGVVLGIAGLIACGVLIKKSGRATAPAVMGGIGSLMLVVSAIGSIGAEDIRQAKAVEEAAAGKKKREADEAKLAAVTTQLAALGVTAKPEEVAPLCAEAAGLGEVPAAHRERCGAALLTHGQAIAAKNRDDGMKLVRLASKMQHPKREDAAALLAKLEAEAMREEVAALLKDSQAKQASGDLAAARKAVNSAKVRLAKATASDKVVAELTKSADAQDQRLEKAETAAAKAARRAGYVKESCAQLSRMFGVESKLSDLQKEELWKAYEGKGFAWDLEVVEVSSDMLGGYTVQFKCGRNSPSFIQDIQMSYPESAKASVIQLEKGAVYEVEGRLKHTSTLLGMTADPI